MATHVHEHADENEGDEATSTDSQWTQEQLLGMISPPPRIEDSDGVTENGPSDTLQDEEAPEISDESAGDMYFEAAEHESVIFGVKLKNIYGIEIPATEHKCWTVNASDGALGLFKPKKELPLTFGRIIALAGDFYSSHEDGDEYRTPICGAFFPDKHNVNSPEAFEAALRRFRSAVKSLKEDTDRNLVQLSDLMDEEMRGVKKGEERAAERKPHDHIHTVANVYHNHECGIPTNQAWWKATMGLKNPKGSLFAWLCYINADHFGDDAATAYKVGHAEAMKLAREAGMKSSDKEKADGLQDAYMHEAFALHYLTDMFSSGHLRTPRRQLHNDNYNQQSFAASRILTGKGEFPIWDFQANYMHDNDSDTGLLVRNQLGHQWLCYGDRQFKESWDIVNRAQIFHCVQASVREVYEESFAKKQEKSPSEFIALKLVPQAMIAAGNVAWKSRGWSNYDMHNPAPLWQVDSEDNKNAWTMRANINDHSNFDRRKATPSSVGSVLNASQECWDAKDSSFRKEGAAPTARPIEGLTSGGFIQIQDLNPADNKIHSCVNFWGPVSVDIHDRQGVQTEHKTFTLRNRIIDFDVQNDVGAVVPLHSMKWHSGDGLFVYRINLRQVSGRDEVTLSRWSVKDNAPSTPNEPVKFDPEKPWAFEAQTQLKDVSVTSLLPSSHPNLVRVIIGRFADRNSPTVAVINFNLKEPLKMSLVAHDGTSKAHLSNPALNGVYNFAKTMRSQAEAAALDEILLSSFEDQGDQTQITFDCVNFHGDELEISRSMLKVEKSQSMSKTVLVGDILNKGSDQALVLFDSAQELILSIHTFQAKKVQETFQKRIPQYISAPLLRPYFNALVPSEKVNSSTPSILQLSLHSVKGKPHLIFRLTDTQTWTTQTSTPIEDTLASDPHYFHIKWIRCARSSSLQYTTSNALLEVFSFYGVLGIRLFSPIDENKLDEYEEIGRLQYMAQTSIGAGLGAEGDWGNGFMPWGAKKDDFIDYVAWTPDASGKVGDGAWGLKASDVARPLVKGWEVTRRPGYKG